MKQTITIHDLYISSGHDFKGRHGMERLDHGNTPVPSVECIEGKGLVGDRYFGYKDDFKGQMTFISLEAIRSVERELGQEIQDRSLFRRNAVASGADLNSLVGKTFVLGDVRFYGTEQCAPCYWMDRAIGEGALAAMENRGGLRCRILTSGTLELGRHSLDVID